MEIPSVSHARWLQQGSGNETDTTIYPTEDSGRALAAAIVSNTFLFLLIFGLSGTVDIRHLKHELRNKFALATGILMQFIIMPLLGFVAVVALKNRGLSEAMGLTLLVVTSSPGGSYSNWWCSTFNADLALSVAMTAVSTMLSIGLLPANLFLYSYLVYGVTEEGGVLQALDLKAIFLSLAIVIMAIVLGLYASYRIDSTKFHKLANKIGSISGLMLILVSVFLTTGNSETSFWSQPWTFYVGVALPCCLGMILANFVSMSLRLTKPECVAISIECCYQNVGIATSVAVNMYDDPVQRAQALAVPLFYGLVEALVIGLYCVGSWKMGWTKAPKDEKLCVVVTKTYELEYSDDHDDDVHDHRSDDDGDDEQEQAPPQEVPHVHLTGWRALLAAPFVPRYPDYGVAPVVVSAAAAAHHAPGEDLEAVTGETPDKSKPVEERNRFVSEDYTATTRESLTPPNTPGGNDLSGIEITQDCSHSS